MHPTTRTEYRTVDEAYADGKARACAAFEASRSPILLMDELIDTKTDSAFAKGWNSVAISEPNTKRLTAMSRDPAGAEQTVEALQARLAAGAPQAPSVDPFALNFK